MRRMRLAFGLGCFAAAGAGCSLFLSSDEFAGGDDPDARSSPEAAAADGAPAANSGDGGADGDPLDGGVTDGNGGPQGPFCASLVPAPTFCADFDSAGAATDGWDFDITQGPGASVALDTGTFFSKPASARLTIPGGIPGTGNGYVARLSYGSPAAGAEVRLQAKLRIESVDPTWQPYLVWLQFGPTAGVFLRSSASEGSILQQLRPEGGGFESLVSPLTKPIPPKTWVTVEVVVAFSNTPTVSVKMDGDVVLAATALDPLVTKVAPQLSIGPGFYTQATVAATDVRFDDVLLDVR